MCKVYRFARFTVNLGYYQKPFVINEPLIDRLHAIPGNTRSVIQQAAGIILYKRLKGDMQSKPDGFRFT